MPTNNHNDRKTEDLPISKNVDASSKYRSTSLSLKSYKIKQRKTQDLTKLYEFDKEEDTDPFFEVFGWNKMTFLESILNKPINNYTRVDLKWNEHFLVRSNSTKENSKESKSARISKKNQETERVLRPIIFDKDENKIYSEYLTNGPMIIEKNAEYHKRVSTTTGDSTPLLHSYYSFITPTYREKDFLNIEDMQSNQVADLEHDKIIINKYIEFDSINHLYSPI